MRRFHQLGLAVCFLAVPSCAHLSPVADRDGTPADAARRVAASPAESEQREAVLSRAEEQRRILAALRSRQSPPAAESESPANRVQQVAHQDAPVAPSPAMPLDAGEEARAPAPALVDATNAPLTLGSAEELALANNPTLVQAQARVVAAEGKWTQVGLKPNPTIGYVGSEIGNEGNGGQNGGFIGQEFVTADKLAINRQAACFEIVEARREWDAQRYRVLTAVRIGFYRLLIAQRSAEIARQLVRVSEESVDTAEQLLEAMQVGRVDLLQARIEANKARVVLRNAQNRELAAWVELATLIGIPGMKPAPVIGIVEPELLSVEFSHELARILAGSPELAAARANVARARWALERARVEPIPNIDAQAGVLYDDSTKDTIAQVQIGIPIPIHDRNQGNIRRAHADLMAAHQEVERIELALENRLAGAMERLANARYRVEQYTESILPDARESLDLVTVAYRAGEFDYLRVLTAQRTYFEANLQYLDALREFWSARLEIDGYLLLEGLQSAAPEDAGPVSR